MLRPPMFPENTPPTSGLGVWGEPGVYSTVRCLGSRPSSDTNGSGTRTSPRLFLNLKSGQVGGGGRGQ